MYVQDAIMLLQEKKSKENFKKNLKKVLINLVIF